MSRESDSSVSFGVGLLAGVVAGVVAGVLYSPKPGEELRKDLKEAADNLPTSVPPEVRVAKDAGIEMIDKVKCQMELQIAKLQDTVKAARMAQAKKKEEAESGIEY